MGRRCNILSSKDIEQIQIKLNRRHSLSTHFSEWGIAEIAVTDLPSAQDPPTELWLPVMRRTTGEQIGVLLVEVGRKFV